MRMLKIYMIAGALTLPGAAMSQQQDSLNNKTLQEIVVLSGTATRTSFSKLDVPLRTIPATINNISGASLQLQGIDDLTGALAKVQGVRPVSTYGAFQHYVIRGFNDFLLVVDGFRDDRQNIASSAPMTNLAAVDHIEVLKGPAGAMFGHSGIGGIISVARKTPGTTPSAEFNILYGGFNTRRISAGAGGPLSPTLRYRADAGISATDGWRGAGSNRNSAYVAFDFTPTEKDRFQLRLGANKDMYDNDAGIPTVNGEMLPEVKRSYRYNTTQSYTKANHADVQLQYTRRLNSRMTVTEQLSYATDLINYLSSESLELTRGKDSVARGYLQFEHHTQPFQHSLDFTWDVPSGRIQQKILAGWSLNVLHRYTDYDNPLRSRTATTIPLTAPLDNQGNLPVINTHRKTIDETMNGIYLQDWVNFSPKFKVLAAIRFDQFSGSYRSDTLQSPTTTASKGDPYRKHTSRLTYRAGFVYEPLEAVNIYGSYATYFKPARQVPGVTNLSLDPESGYQAELGTRLTLARHLTLNVAAFYLLKRNIIVSLGKGLYDQASEAASKGIETDITWQPLPVFSISAGYAFTDARFKNYTSKVTGAGNLTDKRLPFAMIHQFNIQSSYTVCRGATVFAGLSYNGDNYTDSRNTVLLPAYYLVNAGASYTFRRVRVTVNAENLLDNREYFIGAINNTQLYPGAPVNYNVALHYTFNGR
ncbi:TonB-dependent receptor [Chitinophaga sp. Mgbs1]|uniref:TonB-dependent receptor n=1 Tax=Chitinophaga solisilvae TaxID=1233460 RepID=A0A3S1B188_9BACT|nr:TonB-dependent receptor [Chitinophaga solisilvae]